VPGLEVFDSNIWLHGCLFRESRPATLVDAAANGHRDVRVSPYVFKEVVHRLEKPKGRYSSKQVQRATELFADIVVHSPSIDSPSQRAVERVDLVEKENQPASRLVGSVLDIQAKDAPVLIDAYGQGSHVDLFTCDRRFSECDLSEFGISHLPIHHVTPP